MKGIIEFNLPEESQEFETCQNAWKYSACLSDLDNYMRGELKYRERPEAERTVLEEIRAKLLEYREHYGVLD